MAPSSKGATIPEDGSFSVIATGANDPYTKILESHSGNNTSVSFENASGLSYIRYDVYSIDINELDALKSSPQEFLKECFHQLILPNLEKHFSGLKLVCEVPISKENGEGWFFLMHGPISNFVNAATGKASNSYAGVLLTLKGDRILQIIQFKDLIRIEQTDEAAKERLFPQLIHYSKEYQER